MERDFESMRGSEQTRDSLDWILVFLKKKKRNREKSKVDGVECVRCAGCLLLVGKGGILGTCPPIIILRNRYPVVQYKGGNLGIYIYIFLFFILSLYSIYIYIQHIYTTYIYKHDNLLDDESKRGRTSFQSCFDFLKINSETSNRKFKIERPKLI